MNGEWSQKWKKVFVWFAGYFSFIAFALVGGWVILKSEDEDLKKTAKFVFILTLIFAAASAFFAIYNYLFGFMTNYYSSAAYLIYQIFTAIIGIAKIVVFAVYILLTLFGKQKSEATPVENTKPEESEENTPIE